MTARVSTQIRLAADTELTHVCSFAGVDVRLNEAPDHDVKGFIRIDDDLELVGSDTELLRLAKAIEDGVMEMQRLDAHARRKVSPAGDRRENPVPCWKCRTPTPNLAQLCDPCLDAEAEQAVTV